MPPLNKTIVERYAALKVEEEKIANELEFLQPEVMKEIQAAKDAQEDPSLPITTEAIKDLGAFQIGTRKVWHLPESVMDLKAKATAAEQEAKQVGTASFEEVPMLIFKKVKPK